MKEAKHPKGHNCPEGQVYSNKAGKCVTPDLETVDGAENPNVRSRAAPNLTFPTHKKRGDIQKI